MIEILTYIKDQDSFMFPGPGAFELNLALISILLESIIDPHQLVSLVGSKGNVKPGYN